METNTKEKMVNYEQLTEKEKELIEQVFEECSIIFVSAILRIEKAIDKLIDELYKEENE